MSHRERLLARAVPYRRPRLKRRGEHRVEPIAEAVRRPVPIAWNCVALSNHLLLLIVVEDKLEICELVEQPPPVAIGINAMQVVLWPYLSRDRRGVLPQLGTLGIADDDHSQARRYLRTASTRL